MSPADLNLGCQVVLDELNRLAGRRFRVEGRQASHIRARLREGFTVEDCLKVVRYKVREWKDNPRMAKYLRPSTLFNSEKFEAYLAEASVAEHAQNAKDDFIW